MKYRGKVLPITQLGEAVLRAKARPVRNFAAPELERLIADMITTMKQAQGVGIAANQIGFGVRIFVVAPEPNPRYPRAPQMPPLPMINARLVKRSKELTTDWEGCLSIPGLRAKVPRHKEIEIEFFNPDGLRHRAKLSGFVARIFQHEFDHINGLVYMDRVKDRKTFMTEREYRRLHGR